VDHVSLALGAMAGLYRTATFRTDRMKAAADTPTSSATDLAEHLVRGGVPFREAPATVGSIVRRHLDDGVPLGELVAAEPALGEAALPLLEPGAAVAQRTTRGGAGHAPVAEQLERLGGALGEARARLDGLVDRPA